MGTTSPSTRSNINTQPAIFTDEDQTAILAYLWQKATGHRPASPIHCAVCAALHERDALFRIVSPTRDLIAPLCDICAHEALADLGTVEARIDERGRAGAFCVHTINLDGYRIAVVDGDCPCGERGAA